MKKYLFIALALCAVISCSKENITTNNNSALSFTAGFDEGTKSTLNNDRSQSWLGGDQVIVYDVTSYEESSKQGTFTNTSASSSTTATFTLDPASSFEFEAGHKYLALHNATISSVTESVYYIKIANEINYDSDRKYGMPDNTIPVACYFTYSDKFSLQNISFHNITALCVVRVKNNTTGQLNISKINLTTSTLCGVAWYANIFSRTYTAWSNNSYNLASDGGGSRTSTITCNNVIDPGETCDYSTIMSRPYTVGIDVALTVDVVSGTETIATDKKVLQPSDGTRTYKVGDTKVFNIEVTPN